MTKLFRNQESVGYLENRVEEIIQNVEQKKKKKVIEKQKM